MSAEPQKIRVTIVAEYEVTPGVGGWEGCPDAATCAASDAANLEAGFCSEVEVLDWSEIVSVTFAAAEGGQS